MAEEDLKYGWVRGGKVSTPVPLAASQTFKAQSGRFVYLDGSGHATVADDGANELFGFAEESERTSSSTAALESANVIVDPSAVFRIPVAAGTYVITMRGKTCDILIDASGIQGADLTANADEVFIIIDGDATDNNWVEVMLNQNERGQQTVT